MEFFEAVATSGAEAVVVLGGGRRGYAPEYGGETVSSTTLERILAADAETHARCRGYRGEQIERQIDPERAGADERRHVRAGQLEVLSSENALTELKGGWCRRVVGSDFLCFVNDRRILQNA